MKVEFNAQTGEYKITGRADPAAAYNTEKSRMIAVNSWQPTEAKTADGQTIHAMVQLRVPLPKAPA